MRKFVVTLMAALVGTSSASAFWQEALDASLEVGVGYRVDRVDWRVSNNCDSSCYSDYSYYSYGDYSDDEGFSTKQKWNDLQIWQIEAKGKYVTCDNVYLRANGDYGWIVSGKGKRETSFRAGNFSEDFASWHSHTRGHVYDAEIAIGYQFKWCDDSFAIAPLVGYSWNGQHLRNSHFRRGSSSCGDYSSYYSYGDYSYDDCGPSIVNNLRWAGPFIGFDFDYRFGFGCGCEAEWEFFGTYEFHWANLHSRQHFDRDGGYYDDYCSYGYDYYSGYSGTSRVKRHSHDAYGNLFNFGLKWDFCECWTLALKGEFQWWWASHGVERTKLYSTDYCPGPEVEVYAKRGWKGVKHDVASVSLDLGMAF